MSASKVLLETLGKGGVCLCGWFKIRQLSLIGRVFIVKPSSIVCFFWIILSLVWLREFRRFWCSRYCSNPVFVTGDLVSSRVKLCPPFLLEESEIWSKTFKSHCLISNSRQNKSPVNGLEAIAQNTDQVNSIQVYNIIFLLVYFNFQI